MKKRLLTISIIITCLATIASGTLAYFTAADVAHNVITSGNVGIELIEEAIDPTDPTKKIPFEDVDGILPGEDVSKIVSVKNDGAAQAWVRIKADVRITLAEDRTGEPDVSLIGIDWNTADWERIDDYWYYKFPLDIGTTTTPLFTTVTFDKLMDNMYQGCSTEIDVSAQAVQTANNGTAVTEALGWPADAEE